jgi:hypothetical protein
VALYPAFQEYFRTHKPRFLAVWGKNGPFFLSSGAEAFKHDISDADVRFLDTHFALEIHAKEIHWRLPDSLIYKPSLTYPASLGRLSAFIIPSLLARLLLRLVLANYSRVVSRVLLIPGFFFGNYQL